MFRGLLYLAEIGAAAVFVILMIKEVIMPLVKGGELFPMFRGIKNEDNKNGEPK